MSEGRKMSIAGQTNHERHERRKTEFESKLNDRRRMIEICRQVRDNPDSSDSDKLRAIVILAKYTGRPT